MKQAASTYLDLYVIIVLSELSIVIPEFVIAHASCSLLNSNLLSCQAASDDGLELDERSQLLSSQMRQLPLVGIESVYTSLLINILLGATISHDF